MPPKPQSPSQSKSKSQSQSQYTGGFQLPLTYRVFFLLIEPIAALVGAYYAHFRPHDYLTLTHAQSAPLDTESIPLGTSVALSQLANLYMLFAVNEALVLRSTPDLRVWKVVLFGLLLADLGHLYTLSGLGAEVYYGVAGWNAMAWGNVPFVYLGAAMRIAFLAGVGLTNGPSRMKQA